MDSHHSQVNPDNGMKAKLRTRKIFCRRHRSNPASPFGYTQIQHPRRNGFFLYDIPVTIEKQQTDPCPGIQCQAGAEQILKTDFSTCFVYFILRPVFHSEFSPSLITNYKNWCQ